MKYEKDQYTEGMTICGLIIAGAFIWWGISNIIFWDPFWSWLSLIPLAIGASCLVGQIYAVTNRGKLRNAVKYEFEANPNATVEEISAKTGISHKDVRAIILDLKGSGELRGSFSSETGQLKPVEQQEAAGKKSKFCTACGAKLKEGAQFCSYCGIKMD